MALYEEQDLEEAMDLPLVYPIKRKRLSFGF